MKEMDEDLSKISKILEEIKRLLQQLIAIQLYNSGATQYEISRNLRIRKAMVNEMVKGIKKERTQSNAKS